VRFSFCETGFEQCLAEAESIISVGSQSPALEGTLLRSALLLAVSAFDFLIHELARVECVHRVRNRQIVNLDAPLSLALNEPVDLANGVDLLVRRKNSYKAFVSSVNIKEAFSPICDDFWRHFEKNCVTSKAAATKRIDEIWRWRNRIAHEGDFIPSGMTFQHWPIYTDDVLISISFLRDLGKQVILTVRNLP
jgi:hypothetical protein